MKTEKKILRKMGFLKDQKGILNRYINEKDNWDSHLENCKDFILENTKKFTSGKLAVLGSGWLLDLPIEELLHRFDEIHLYDISHPNQIQNRFKNDAKVIFHEIDITGGLIEWFYNFTKENRNKQFIPFNEMDLKSIQFKPETQFDFVISLNILNQLNILIIDYLESKFDTSKLKLNSIRRIIQESHIDYLTKNKFVLIADIEDEYYDDDNRFTGSKSTLFTNFPETSIKKEWKWIFDTHFQYKEDFKTYFNVKAVAKL